MESAVTASGPLAQIPSSTQEQLWRKKVEGEAGFFSWVWQSKKPRAALFEIIGFPPNVRSVQRGREREEGKFVTDGCLRKEY